MIEVGGHPILWHIMNLYAHRGLKDFVVALGYKGEVIKDYFLGYHAANSDMTVDLATGAVEYHKSQSLDWKVCMVDTGMETNTGGRLHRLESYLWGEGTFMLTYGDGVSDVDLSKVLAFHREHGKLATLTAVRPPARFGTMIFDGPGTEVVEFAEKSSSGAGWINGGFFVFEPGIFDYLSGDQTILEAGPLEQLAADGQLVAYCHDGFWQCMDTLLDKQRLEELWQSGNAPWKVWDEPSVPILERAIAGR